MSSRVELWIDPASDFSLLSVFDHTSICVIFDNDLKYLFSYNEHGLSCSPATDQTSPKERIYLGRTNKTLPEIIAYAQRLRDTTYRKYSAIGRNCNDFSNSLSMWLCNKQIPAKYLLQDVAATGLVATGLLGGIVAIAMGIFSR